MGFYPPDGDVYEVFDASLQVTYAFLKRHLWSGRWSTLRCDPCTVMLTVCVYCL